ncbi:multi-sensor signal transduction histidine kinase [Candidatus Magnetobacterium bavaricum]|uniref:histidine kinase n=1 Tax=Candidatus Magnetobacterium bavaricum TaxID=29290 RepID=A0A0F3GXZ2_9BACT|nr:multi-sensor signal transduction histidine kinase [Candidatus Magnetobacterium bavaricum]
MTEDTISEDIHKTRREREMMALLEGARAVLKYKRFEDVARDIFDKCKAMTGATSGYVALLNSDGDENEVLFLDPGGRECVVDPLLPMPIRGLRETVYRSGKAACENNFSNSKWWDYLPEGHVMLDNVLFAPLNLEGKTVGLIGLANKPGNFDDDDLHIATAFGEFVAIALHNSQTLQRLGDSEQRFRNVVEAAGDAIVSIGSDDRITTWNKAAEDMFGYTVEEALGSPVTIIIPQHYRDAHREGIMRVNRTGISKHSGQILDLTALRKDGSEFPIELSLTKWTVGERLYFAAIIRDVSRRKQIEEELRVQNQLVVEQSRQLAISELMISIAHHWRQPLSAIGAIIQNVEDAFDYEELDGELFHSSVKKIVDELVYLSKTIDNFSSFYHRDKEKTIFKLNDCIEKTLLLLNDYFRSKDITVEVDMEDNLELEGYFNEFSRVILNIINNIKDVFDERAINNGHIKIRAYRNTHNNRVTLSISDNGGGMKEDIKFRVFDPYFTTKHKSRGVGLGLYMARVMIEKNLNGSITAINIDNGTEFIIEI